MADDGEAADVDVAKLSLGEVCCPPHACAQRATHATESAALRAPCSWTSRAASRCRWTDLSKSSHATRTTRRAAGAVRNAPGPVH